MNWKHAGDTGEDSPAHVKAVLLGSNLRSSSLQDIYFYYPRICICNRGSIWINFADFGDLFVIYLYINLACLSVCLSVCLFVCLFVSNKRQNGWTDQAQIFCGTSRDPWEGLWMIKFSKICLHQNSIFENFENPRFFFWKSAKFFVFIIC